MLTRINKLYCERPKDHSYEGMLTFLVSTKYRHTKDTPEAKRLQYVKVANLQCIYVNSETLRTAAIRVAEIKMWSPNAHCIAASLLHYRFKIDESLENSVYSFEFKIVSRAPDESPFACNIYHTGESNPMRYF